jgi:hypothetical protein
VGGPAPDAHIAADSGLQLDASDRAVWEACQREHVILLTANRNEAGPDSLQATIQQYSTPASLPVFTLAIEPFSVT